MRMSNNNDDDSASPNLISTIMGNILQSKKMVQGEKIEIKPAVEITIQEPDSENKEENVTPSGAPIEQKEKGEEYLVVDTSVNPLLESDSELPPLIVNTDVHVYNITNNDNGGVQMTENNEGPQPLEPQSQPENKPVKMVEGEPGEPKEQRVQQDTQKTRGDIDHEKWNEICDIPHIRKLPRYEGDKMIYISAEAYSSIVLYATRYANDSIPRNRWNEIYGILIGKISDGIIFVNRAEPMTVGHSVDVQLGPEHYVFIAQIQDELENAGKGEFMVGWFHSHPGLTLFYSYTDLMNHLNFQTANPDFIGIVFDQIYIKEKPGHPGIVVYRLNDTTMDVNKAEFENNYHEMRYRIIGLNLPFLSQILLRCSNNYGKGYPLQLSYGEKLNPQSIPLKVIKTQEAQKPKVAVTQNIAKPSAEPGASAPQKPLSSIPGVPAKTTTKVTVKKSDGPLQVTKIDAVGDKGISNEKKDKVEEIKEILDIKDLHERGIKYMMEAKKTFYLKKFDASLAYFKLAFKSFKDAGQKSIPTYLKSVNEAFDLFFKEEILSSAQELAQLLVNSAEEFGDMYYLGMGQQFLGEIKIQEGKIDDGIDNLDQATVVYSKLQDYAGAGYANYLIGEKYYEIGEWDHAGLYYSEAVSNFQHIKSFTDIYAQRKDVWATPSNIKKMVSNIKAKLEELKAKITDKKVLERIATAMK